MANVKHGVFFERCIDLVNTAWGPLQEEN